MNITRIETGTIIALVLAVIAGAVQFGRLQGQIDSLNPDVVRETQNAALGQIDQAKQSAIDEMNGQAAKMRLDDLAALTSTYLQRQWCDVSGQRQPGETYTNNRSLPIELAVATEQGGTGDQTNRCNLEIFIDDLRVVAMRDNFHQLKKLCSATVTVPAGATYRVASMGYETEVIVSAWSELTDDCGT